MSAAASRSDVIPLNSMKVRSRSVHQLRTAADY